MRFWFLVSFFLFFYFLLSKDEGMNYERLGTEQYLRTQKKTICAFSHGKYLRIQGREKAFADQSPTDQKRGGYLVFLSFFSFLLFLFRLGCWTHGFLLCLTFSPVFRSEVSDGLI
ncbi:hypothetical protein F4861DRAFT_126504 [Xylaria intraflava]|nr:hypothetical protein F4861DRAFT_126504 [Xylaria intraflava]